MAVDTPAKRFSMMNTINRTLAPMFEVDGAVDKDDRQHLLLMYGGIAFGSPGGEEQFGIHLTFIPGDGMGLFGGQFS